MKKIILLSHGFQSEYEAGIANGIANSHKRTVLIGSDTTQVQKLHPDLEFINLRGSQTTTRSITNKFKNIFNYYVGYNLFLLKNYGASVHIIGQFSTRSKVFSIFELLSTRILSKILILTVHNVLPHDAHTRINFVINKFLYKIPDAIIVHTKKIKEALCSNFGVSPTKIHVIEHGINEFVDFEAGARKKYRDALGLTDSSKLLLFFGNMAWYKGPDLLIEALGKVQASADIHLLIAGRCRDKELHQKISSWIASSSARERIHWQDGFIPDEDVRTIFFAADLLVLPYRHIDQSGVLFMAMAAGLPVLATDVGAFYEYAQYHPITVIPVNDGQALFQNIDDFTRYTNENRAHLIENARKFDWKNTVTPLLQIYKQPSIS